MVAPGSSKPLLFYPPVHPKQDVEVNAVVSHVNTPSDFYVQLVGSKAHTQNVLKILSSRTYPHVVSNPNRNILRMLL